MSRPGPTAFDRLLADLRGGRAIAPRELLDAKVGRLTGWFTEQGLDAAVVGVSGGIDSAVVAGLLAETARRPGSPLRRIVALLVPVEGPGATGQSAATVAGRRIAAHLGLEVWEVPLAAAHRSTLDALATAAGHVVDDWAAGQLLSVERTPVLYGAAAVLQSQGHRSVVVGTTNRDEGAYLGFFGKASDGAVDLQPISDLHKSEVRALAEELGLPAQVLGAVPRGDVWDGRSDEEMIGTDYDGVEAVLRLRELGRDPATLAAQLGDDRLATATEAVERLHAHNAHKYRVGSPAVHLDVVHRGVPGGWPDETLSDRFECPPAADLPGRWTPPAIDLGPVTRWPTMHRRPGSVVAADALTAADCRRLLAALAEAPCAPVGVSGRVDDPGVGSHRATAFAPDLAAALWLRIAPLAPSVLVLGDHDPTDGHADATRAGHRTWRSVGLSPLLRFMRYEPGGRHDGHYDAGYDYGDGRRTLCSVVCFLTDAPAGAGGALRFLDDGQAAIPVWRRRHEDWTREARPDEVVERIEPAAGTVVVFLHRRCHDVERWDGPGARVVIRADVVYERVPDGRSLP